MSKSVIAFMDKNHTENEYFGDSEEKSVQALL